ncbi:MAG: chemotaxis protein CheX [Tepidisphaerales bacterium]
MLQLENDNLVTALVDALEQMAFVSALPPEGEPATPLRPLLLRISFRGPVCQRFELIADEELGSLMAANIFGAESAEARFRARDALKELLNVTCGLVLSRWPALEDRNFEMSIPEVVPLDAAGWQELLAEGGFTLLDAEGHLVAIRLADRK